MNSTIDLPQTNVLIGCLTGKQGSFKCHVIACNHRKAIQGQNIAQLYLATGNRVMCTVCVDAGLKPRPGIKQLCMGPAFGNFPHHGRRAVQGNFVFRNTHSGHFCTGRAADVGDTSHLGDMRNLLI